MDSTGNLWYSRPLLPSAPSLRSESFTPPLHAFLSVTLAALFFLSLSFNLFIYSYFYTKNLKKWIPQTPPPSLWSAHSSLLCLQYVWQMWRLPVWPGKTVPAFAFDWRTTVVFLKPPTVSCQKPKLHFAALMLMMSCNPQVHQITAASFLLAATLI